MKSKLFSLLLLLSFAYLSGNAQKYTFKGSIKDTVAYTTTLYTSVSLLNAKDSVLKAFTRADEEGNFSLSVDSPGTYIIIVAHPLFANYIDKIATEGTNTEIGTIGLISKLQLIQEVIVSDRRAITIKGDTTEYAADSFKVREFDNVDALLKRLPGLEVDKDGKIKAHGETVQKMMVDGDEFFADDPAMVAKMLRASAVDKVQVFDKKSEQAEFTGIDDGEKIKTINLQLKESARKGYFGKLAAGGSADGYWENQAMINAFNSKRKISAFGIMSNTNSNGLGWEESGKYGGGNGFEFNDDGSMTSSFESSDESDWNGNYSGQGLPKTWTGGVHYGNKWLEKDALSLNGDYRYSKNNKEAYNNTRTQYILPDTQYINNSVSNSFSSSQRNKANAVVDYKIDSLTSIRISANGSLTNSINQSDASSNQSDMMGNEINDSRTQQLNENKGKSIDASVLLRRKFAKEGRSISVNVATRWNESTKEGSQYSLNRFFTLGRVDSFNQRKQGNNQTLVYNAKISYTEPLAKKIFLELNYSIDVNNRKSAQYTFDRLPELGSDTLNQLFSSDYIFNVLTNSFGANVRFNYEKIKLSFGGNIANAAFKQKNNFDNSSLNYNYLNFFPKANISFSRTKQSNINLNYNGRTTQPTIEQLQPIRRNDDPMDIMIGNPNLKQQFNHSLALRVSDYKVLSQRNLWASGNFGFTQNAITQSQNIDEGGRRTYQNINMDGNWNANLYAGYGINIKPINLNANFNISGGYTKSNTMVNGLKNVSNNQNYGPGLSFYYSKDTLMNLSYNTNVNYNRNSTSIRPDIINDYWSWNQDLNATINLPYKFEIGTSIEWFIRQKIDDQDRNSNVFRMNAHIAKSFLKDRSLVAKFAGYDIFNQNIGFTRSAMDTYITESRYNNIRRYFMLSLTWNFTKSGAMAPATSIDISGE